MARREEGVTERLVESARAEFLEKGYDGASLRSIANRAESSKGAIYIRYADKAELYAAVVMPAADGLVERLASAFGEFGQIPVEEQESRMYSFADAGLAGIVDYIYDHFEDFKILACSGEESLCSTLIDRLVELDTKTTYRYIEAVGNDAVEAGRLTPRDNAHDKHGVLHRHLRDRAPRHGPRGGQALCRPPVPASTGRDGRRFSPRTSTKAHGRRRPAQMPPDAPGRRSSSRREAAHREMQR